MMEKKSMSLQRHKRIIISGGGTGGHIFPAISVANALRRIDPEMEILFVGAEGRMEMEKIPAAGYRHTQKLHSEKYNCADKTFKKPEHGKKSYKGI
jgi:UDP-N-acetylglucosamine:LPS N-acetylglucosamine transferase